MAELWTNLALTSSQFLFLIGCCLLAGMVRGFAGFALSAVVMALAVLVLPPVEIIPILWWQEMTASVLMVRGGWREADRRIVLGLVIGSTIGLPVGLALTQALPVDLSKMVALSVIIALALSQLAKLRISWLASTPGLYGSGLIAGIVSGLANVGGMVVAIYMLAQDAPARVMRASLVVFLATSFLIAIVTLIIMGVMTETAVWRGLALAPFSALGVALGTLLFRPAWEPYYKPFCLILLIALALISLVREVVL